MDNRTKRRIAIFGIIILICVGLVIGFTSWRNHKIAKVYETLDDIITAVENESLLSAYPKIELKPEVAHSDFSHEYVVEFSDFTFGWWEFIVKFQNGKRYYFDIRDYDGIWEGFIAIQSKDS